MKKLKTKIAVTIALTTLGVAAMSFDILDDTGKAGRTGSPGETTCTGCHTGAAINDGVGSVVISSPDLGVNWEYMPGDTYQIDVTVARAGSPLFGFDIECLTGSTPAQNAGVMVVTNTQETHLLNATVSTVVRKNMTHQLNAGLSSNSKTFSFMWIAPATNVGNVTFYCTGNAANNNGAKTGDFIYSTTQVVTPAFGAGTGDFVKAENDFTVFPNPVNENIFVTYNVEAGQKVDFSLFTLEGKMAGPMYTFQGTGFPATSQLNLPSDLASGVYFVKMQSESIMSIQKVVIE